MEGDKGWRVDKSHVLSNGESEAKSVVIDLYIVRGDEKIHALSRVGVVGLALRERRGAHVVFGALFQVDAGLSVGIHITG